MSRGTIGRAFRWYISAALYRGPLRSRVFSHSSTRTKRLGTCTFMGLDCSEEDWQTLCSVGSRVSRCMDITQSDFGVPGSPPEIHLYYVTKENSLRLFPRPVAQMIRDYWKDAVLGFWSSCLDAAFVISSGREDLAATVVHELSHACLDRTAWGLPVPVAVFEGYARLTEDRLMHGFESPHHFPWAVRIHQQASPHGMRLSVAALCQTDYEKLQEEDDTYTALFYAYATLLTDCFSQLRPRTGTGDSILPAIRRARARTSPDCVQRIAAAAGYSVEELEQGFRDYCRALPPPRVY